MNETYTEREREKDDTARSMVNSFDPRKPRLKKAIPRAPRIILQRLDRWEDRIRKPIEIEIIGDRSLNFSYNERECVSLSMYITL